MYVSSNRLGPFLLNTSALIMSLLAVIWLVQLFELTTPHSLDAFLQNSNIYITAIVLILLMILCALTPLPAEAVTLANGMIFGPLYGSILTWISAMLSAYIAFRLARRFKQKFHIKQSHQQNWEKVNTWMQRWGTLGFLIARLVPVVPFFALNIGAAFLPLSTREYIVITGIAILPHILLICYFGGHLH